MYGMIGATGGSTRSTLFPTDCSGAAAPRYKLTVLLVLVETLQQ